MPDNRIPAYPLPDANGEKKARLYILNNIWREFDGTMSVLYDTPHPKEDALYYESLLHSEDESIANRAKQFYTVACFRHAMKLLCQSMQAQAEGRPLDADEMNEAKQWLEKSDQYSDEVYLEGGRKAKNIVRDVIKEAHNVAQAPFEQILGEWIDRTEKAIQAITQVKDCTIKLHLTPAQQSQYQSLAQACIDIARSKRGTREYTAAFFEASRLRFDIVNHLDETLKINHLPDDEREKKSYLKQAANAMFWMGRWGRVDHEQVNHLTCGMPMSLKK